MKKRALLQIIVTLAVSTSISTGVYFLLCKELRKTTRDNIGKFNYMISDTTYYNTVFIGASSTHTGVNPVFFDSLTGAHSFNAGMDGITIPEFNLILTKYVKSHKPPENIFIVLDEITLGTDNSIWSFPQYYPYISDPDFKNFIDREPRLLLGKYCPPAALTYMDDPLKTLGFIGLVHMSSAAHELSTVRGYLPISPTEITPFSSVANESDSFTTTPKGWNLFEQTLKFCKENNINVCVTNAPRYNMHLPYSTVGFLKELKLTCQRNSAKFFLLDQDKRLQANYLFADFRHLNSKGADVYTSILAEEFLKSKSP